MRKVWSQLGLAPWEYEINLLAEQGMDPWKAKCSVIISWMKAGDPRPLLWAIKNDGVLRGPPLGQLVRMLQAGELTFKLNRDGRRPDPEAAARDLFAADAYEDFLKHYRVGSDNLFQAIGAVTGVSEESVRQAVKAKRKTKKS